MCMFVSLYSVNKGHDIQPKDFSSRLVSSRLNSTQLNSTLETPRGVSPQFNDTAAYICFFSSSFLSYLLSVLSYLKKLPQTAPGKRALDGTFTIDFSI